MMIYMTTRNATTNNIIPNFNVSWNLMSDPLQQGEENLMMIMLVVGLVSIHFCNDPIEGHVRAVQHLCTRKQHSKRAPIF